MESAFKEHFYGTGRLGDQLRFRNWPTKVGLLVVFTASVLGSWLLLPETLVTSERSFSVITRELEPKAQQACEKSTRIVLRGSILWADVDAHPYQNLFQTADLNTGLRAEIDPDGVLSFVLPLASGTQPPGLSALIKIKPNFKHSIILSHTSQGVTSISIDNQQLERTFPEQSFSCSHPLIGGGFDSNRPFKGKHDLTLSFESEGIWNDRLKIIIAVTAGLMSLGVSYLAFTFRLFRTILFLGLFIWCLATLFLISDRPTRTELYATGNSQTSKRVSIPRDGATSSLEVRIGVLRNDGQSSGRFESLLRDPLSRFSLSCFGRRFRLKQVVASDTDLSRRQRILTTEIKAPSEDFTLIFQGGSILVRTSESTSEIDQDLRSLRTSLEITNSPLAYLTERVSCAEILSIVLVGSSAHSNPVAVLVMLNLLIIIFIFQFSRTEIRGRIERTNRA